MTTGFSLYVIVLVVGVTPCVVAAGALAARAVRRRRAVDGWLAAVLVSVLLQTAPYALGFAGAYDAVGWLSNLPISNPFLTGAVVLGYVWAVAEPGRAGRWGVWLFAPAAVALGVGLWVWARTAFGGVPFGATTGPWMNRAFGAAGLVFNVACGAAAVAAVVKARQRGAATAYERAARGWLIRFLGAYGVALAVAAGFTVAFALGAEFSYGRQWWAHAAYVALGYYVAIAGYAFSRQADVAPVPREPAAPPLSDAEVAAWRPRLEAWVREHRPHLRPDLTVAALAGEVGLSPAELSHVVNAGFGRNFNEYVNGHRVREVQARMLGSEAEALTLLALAEASGFRSKATFNRAFRRETGTTPSAWRAEQLGAADAEGSEAHITI